MRRFTAAILAATMLFAMTACNKTADSGKADRADATPTITASDTSATIYGFEDEPEENSYEYIVDNEENAQKIINCSHRNLFGIEKVVMFEDKLVAVFDKNTHDKTGGFLGGGTKAVETMWLSFNNLSAIEADYSVTEDGEKYILEASCTYDESNLVDPDREVKITRFIFKGECDTMNIYIYADDLELHLYKENHDSYTHYYHASDKKWDSVIADIYEEPEPEDFSGITYSYELDLADCWSPDLEYEIDGIRYHINGYGNYLYLEVENTTNETKSIGGTRYIQRVNGDDLIDLGRDNREIHLMEGQVKDLTPVNVWIMPKVDPDEGWSRSVTPDMALSEGESFEIGPGQKCWVEILIEDFDIYKDGFYRLTFGEATMDFELGWMVIC